MELNKSESMISILRKLDEKKQVTVYSLMDELNKSERSVYRYIQTLQNAGFPIVYDRNIKSYSFSEGYSLRRLDLSLEETLAFALAKSIFSNFGTGMEKSLSSIEEKLAKKKVNLPRHIILSAETPSGATEKYLGVLHRAIDNYQQVEMTYKSLYSDEKTERKVKPYFLFLHEGFWYLRGYCHKADEERTFALDRIISLKVLDEHFLPKSFNPEDELSASFGTWLDGEPTDVVLIFDKEIKPYVLRKKWHKSQQERELKDGRLEMKFNVKGLGGVKKWIYQWLPHVEVVEPEELREEMRKELYKAIGRIK